MNAITRDTVSFPVMVNLDLKRGLIMCDAPYIGDPMPPWLWLRLTRNYPVMLTSDDVAIEFEAHADIEVDRGGPGPVYVEASGLVWISGGDITNEYQSIKFGKKDTLPNELIGEYSTDFESQAVEAYEI